MLVLQQLPNISTKTTSSGGSDPTTTDSSTGKGKGDRKVDGNENVTDSVREHYCGRRTEMDGQTTALIMQTQALNGNGTNKVGCYLSICIFFSIVHLVPSQLLLIHYHFHINYLFPIQLPNNSTSRNMQFYEKICIDRWINHENSHKYWHWFTLWEAEEIEYS